MIPKIIHQIWIGPKPAPKFMKEWPLMYPEYEYILWDNDKVNELFPLKNQHLYDGYDNETSNVWNGRSNLLRLEILNKYGGLYIDADTNPLRKMEDSFLNDQFFAAYANEKARGDLIAWGVMGTTPDNNILQTMIDSLNTKSKIKQPSHIFSGPTFFTNTIKGNKFEIKIYPSYYFYPNFYRNNSKYEYKGNFKPYTDHVWGTTKNLYGKI